VKDAERLYKADPAHINSMSDEDLERALTSNVNFAENAEARLTAFVPEAIRRGLAVSAKTLLYARLEDEDA
jgi:hypothetical protein